LRINQLKSDGIKSSCEPGDDGSRYLRKKSLSLCFLVSWPEKKNEGELFVSMMEKERIHRKVSNREELKLFHLER
jgi:hypothetical protein